MTFRFITLAIVLGLEPASGAQQVDTQLTMQRGAAMAPPVGVIESVPLESVTSVPNAPFTADAETEFTQVLGDGNRIERRYSSMIARQPGANAARRGDCTDRPAGRRRTLAAARHDSRQRHRALVHARRTATDRIPQSDGNDEGRRRTRVFLCVSSRSEGRCDLGTSRERDVDGSNQTERRHRRGTGPARDSR